MLTAVILTPLLGSLIVALLGRPSAKVARVLALLASLASFGVVIAAVATSPGSQAASGAAQWWMLTMDGIAAPLLLLTGFLGVIAVLAARSETRSPAAHYALLLAVQASVSGVFLAGNLVLFYAFWEAVLIPMYFIIGIWGAENRRHAAMKFFIYTFAGSALMLVGLIIAMFQGNAFAMGDLLSTPLSVGLQGPVFWLLSIGFLMKLPVVGLHTWQPDAYTQAPTSGSILLSGVLAKMGAYALLRIAIPIAPAAYDAARPVLVALGIIGIIYGALVALAQSDLKRLIAYSSIAHMGFVVLAIGIGTPLALGAAMLVMISHGLVAGMLFLLAGQLYERTGTYEMSRLGGFGKVLPAWATAFTFAALASLGLPGLSGFPGELAAVLESWGSIGWWTALAALGVVFSAAYNLTAVRRVNHGPVAEEFAGIADLGLAEWLAVAPLAVGIVVVGVWPQFVTGMAEPALRALAAVTGGAL